MNLRRLLVLALLLGPLLSPRPARAADPAAPAARTILVLGDSLTFGYGLPDPANQSYPALLQQKLDARATAAPGAPRWRVVNAGVSGDTTSGGLRRVDWVSRQPVAILVLALGSNDGLRGLDPALVETNLAAIGDRLAAKNPGLRVLLVGQRMPVSMGDYAARFEALFPRLAAARGWPLAPFLLEGVGGVPEFNQADAIHPNEAGHARMAETVWAALAPLLETPADLDTPGA
jgi:acyl-CoA thioesterase-1